MISIGLRRWYINITITILGPPLWSSGQSSWIQIQRSGFYSRSCQIIWDVVGLERGPLSLVNTIEELLERKSSGSSLESREYGRSDPSLWPSGTLYPQKLALTSPTSSGRLVGIVRSRTQVTGIFVIILDILCRPSKRGCRILRSGRSAIFIRHQKILWRSN
jgi:hypothetical protein